MLPEKSTSFNVQQLVQYEGRTTNNTFIDRIYGEELSYLSESEYKAFLELLEYPEMHGSFFDLSIDNNDTDVSNEFIQKLFENDDLFGILMDKVSSMQTKTVTSLENVEGEVTVEDYKIGVNKLEHDGKMALKPISFSEIRSRVYNLLDISEELSTETIGKIQRFLDATSLDNLMNTLQGTYKINIDGEEFSKPMQEMFMMLLEDEKSFKRRFDNKDSEEAKRLAYALKTFVTSVGEDDGFHYMPPNLFDLYDFPNIAAERFERLCNYKYADFRGVNLVPSIKGKYSDKFNINEELRKAVYEGMPEDFSDLEKSMYIYGRLCQLLDYDTDFFASEEHGEAREKHSDIKRLNDITPENNVIVCYEFANIYSKFLEEQNINNIIITRSGSEASTYSGFHSLCMVKADGLIFSADSTDRIVRGDLVNAKLGAKITGMRLHYEFDDDVTRKHFYGALSRVSCALDTQIKQPSLSNLIDKYREISGTDFKKQTREQKREKFEMYKSLLQDTDVKSNGIARMAYMLDVTKAMYHLDDVVSIEPLILYRVENDKRILTSIIICKDKASHSKAETFFEYTPDGELSLVEPTEFAKDISDGRIGAMRRDKEYLDEKLMAIMDNYLPKHNSNRDEV